MVEYDTGSNHGRAAQVHLQLMQTICTMQRQSDPQPWAQGWSLSSPASTSTCKTNTTTFECAGQARTNATTSGSTSIIFEYEQYASQCTIPCANGCRSLFSSKAEPAVSRLNGDLNVLQIASSVKKRADTQNLLALYYIKFIVF